MSKSKLMGGFIVQMGHPVQHYLVAPMTLSPTVSLESGPALVTTPENSRPGVNSPFGVALRKGNFGLNTN